MKHGEERINSFLCCMCRHFYPKENMKRIGQKHIKVCLDCFKMK